HLARRSAPELGRVEQYAIVAPAAPDLARGELACIVDDPADRAVIETGKRRILFPLLDGFLGGVDVHQPRAGFAERQRADAGVAEQVEHVGVGSTLPHPVPLRGHVGEEAEVAEWGQRGGEADISARELPLPRHRAVLDPAAAALLVRAGDEGRVRVPVAACRRPHRLRLRPDHLDVAVAFELLAATAIDEAPVAPGLGDERREFGHAANASWVPTEATAARPSSNAAPASFADAASTERRCSSSSSTDRTRPNTSIDRAMWSARPCALSKLISSPASSWVRARWTSASVRVSTASARMERARCMDSTARLRSAAQLSATIPVSA